MVPLPIDDIFGVLKMSLLKKGENRGVSNKSRINPINKHEVKITFVEI